MLKEGKGQTLTNSDSSNKGGDPLSPLQATISRLVEQQRQWEEMGQRFTDPLQETVARIVEQHRQWEEMGQRFTDPLQETIARIVEQQRQWEEAVKRFTDPFSPLQKTFLHFAEQENRLQESFRNIFSRFSTDQSIENLDSVFSKLKAIAQYTENEPLEITADAQIQSRGLTLSVQDATVLIDQFISKSASFSGLAERQQSLSDTLDSIYEDIKKQNSTIRIILFYVILPFLLSLFVNLITPNMEELRNQLFTKKQVINKVREEAISVGLRSAYLHGLRVVIASALKVRNSPNSRAKFVGILYQGQVVKVVTEVRDWTLVEVSDGTITLRGWAFTRYLKRFDSRSNNPSQQANISE